MKGSYHFKIYRRFDDWQGRMILNILGFLNKSWKLKFLEKYGEVRDEWSVDNLITDAGRAQLALLGGDGTATPFSHMAVGTSTTAPAVGQTTLAAEVTDTGLARAAATFSRVTTAVANDTMKFLYTWTATGSKTIEEVGVFNASSGGVMLGRALTGTKALANGETLAGDYRCQLI